jgi:hypothetical protein
MFVTTFFIPAKGIRLGFKTISLVNENGHSVLSLYRRAPSERRRLLQRHIIKDDISECFRKLDGVDFEIVVSRSAEGSLDYAHAFVFLLIIRTGGWINAPALLSASVLEQPEYNTPHVYCQDFIEETPCSYADVVLSIKDARWISKHIRTALLFTQDSRFQNAMQALNSFHCIPYANMCLLTAWSGLEALFKTDQEISFRLSLYISNFIRRGPHREAEFARLRSSYSARSRIAHGESTKTKGMREHAIYTRDILRECLMKSIEEESLPDPNKLIFGK